jgi:hypothetical protein
MLNLVITSSPRLAAMTANRPLGEDVVREPSFLHRLAWSRLGPVTASVPPGLPSEQSLRERTA